MAHRSLWLQEALAAESGVVSSELTDSIQADVCVVGGGYTGLWTALRARELEPSAEVVIVEADICGGGPSGRNGGFALSWWPKAATLVKRLGEEEALRLVRASVDAVTELGDFCEREGIDAHYRRGGWLWTATSPAQLNSWDGTVALAEQPRGASLRGPLGRGGQSPDRVTRSTSGPRSRPTPRPSSLPSSPAASGAWPSRAASSIFEHSPMVDLDREQGVVRTRSGSVQANAIVLATGAWLAGVPGAAPRGRRRLQRHGGDGAHSGPARGGGLDRRRVGLGLPPHGALLPHDEGRPDRVRPGRPPSRHGRARRRRLLRLRPGRGARSSSRTSSASSRSPPGRR